MAMLALIIITVVFPDLVLVGVSAPSAMLPEQRPQPVTMEEPLPAAPQAQIFHMHPTNASVVATKPTPTLLHVLLFFFFHLMMTA